MAKRKTPTARAKADSRKPKLDKVSIADANLANLRNLPTYFGQDGLKRNAHAQEGAKAATEALQYLEAGNVQEAVYHAMGAMMAVVRIERGTGKIWHEFTLTLVALGKVMAPLAQHETNRRLGKGDKFQKKLDDATERLATLLNGNSNMRYTAKVRKAAREADISDRAFRKHMPAYLKNPKR